MADEMTAAPPDAAASFLEAWHNSTTSSESGFANWCGVGVLSGWQFRSRQHAKGSAIDLDAKFNPYVPMGRAGAESDLSGEVHSQLGATEHGNLRKAALVRANQAHSLPR